MDAVTHICVAVDRVLLLVLLKHVCAQGLTITVDFTLRCMHANVQNRYNGTIVVHIDNNSLQ
jgi:hypothetical protein